MEPSPLPMGLIEWDITMRKVRSFRLPPSHPKAQPERAKAIRRPGQSGPASFVFRSRASTRAASPKKWAQEQKPNPRRIGMILRPSEGLGLSRFLRSQLRRFGLDILWARPHEDTFTIAQTV